MKKTLYITGTFTLIFLLLGIFLKVFHFPGGDIAFIIGMLIAWPVFATVFLWNRIAADNRYLAIISIISAILVSVGANFILNRFSYGKTILLIGCVSSVMTIVLLIIRGNSKSKEQSRKVLLNYLFVGLTALIFTSLWTRYISDNRRDNDALARIYFSNIADSRILEKENEELFNRMKVLRNIKDIKFRSDYLINKISETEKKLLDIHGEIQDTVNLFYESFSLNDYNLFFGSTKLIDQLADSLHSFRSIFIHHPKFITDHWEQTFFCDPAEIMVELSRLRLSIHTSVNIHLNDFMYRYLAGKVFSVSLKIPGLFENRIAKEDFLKLMEFSVNDNRYKIKSLSVIWESNDSKLWTYKSDSGLIPDEIRSSLQKNQNKMVRMWIEDINAFSPDSVILKLSPVALIIESN